MAAVTIGCQEVSDAVYQPTRNTRNYVPQCSLGMKRAPMGERRAGTVLFFGDSVTRGYGVGREGRFAALVETGLHGRSGAIWAFEVASATSDFRVFRTRLEVELEQIRPVVLVCQCPIGPACFFPRFPRWARSIMAIENRLLARLTAAHVESELRGGDGRTRHEALYEGRYLDRVMRWQPSNWPLVGRLWRARVTRYPTIPKLTCERYVRRMAELRDRAREAGVRQTLFLGLLPIAEDVCPGYRERAPGWCAELRRVLDGPGRSSRFLDVYAVLRDGPLGALLLKDRVHLSEEGHRRVAALVAPALEPLLARAIAG
jgi:lysophospholipase L1-like esterase